ncbi:MAG: PadR-like family transcriptional regulator [Promethearchaeota archaeon CR_4]|nr:MAG: PadR-like family transcriptional regulator [Candidatus Lokiarchaeota archaeon CR_4]
MIKRVKNLLPNAPFASEEVREYLERFESEILRGISNLVVLTIIRQHGSEGIHGYALLKDLEEQTNHMLIIEEGTLYPLLRKLKQQGLVAEEDRQVNNRTRKHYRILPLGNQMYNFMVGFFSKMLESIAPLIEIDVGLRDEYLYCPNCANKIDLSQANNRFCEMCGMNVEELRNRRSTT